MNRVLWDTIKLTNMHKMGENFPILMKNTNLHMQEVQQIQKKCNKLKEPCINQDFPEKQNQ